MRYFLILFFSFFFLFNQAQEIVVLSKSTNEPIPGVAIFNNSKTISTITNINGEVSLELFLLDESINFQHLAYKSLTIVKSKIKNKVYLDPKTQSLEEVVISASKFEQNRKEVPQRIVSIKSEDVVFNNPQTSADLLQSSGQVYIQKSQLGGGSPMIRGFSTNRLMLSIDGVRMNNAIFRGGNVQNIISLDPFTIQSTEIILGSGSVIYGSDAIGGVMNFFTKKPKLSSTDSLEFNMNSVIRYSSANNEKTGHLDFNFGKKKWAFLTSFSYTDFDDLKMGRHGPDDYLRPEYVITEGGLDQIVQNKDSRIQKFTGYDQINILQKINYRSNDKLSFDLGLHYSTTSNYPRYDRLIRYSNGELHSAEWYYGPQRWFLGNFKITKLSSSSNLYDKIKFTTAYQNFQESRIDRDLNSETRRIRKENLDAISVNIDLEKSISEKAKLFYGSEYILNSVNSRANEQNINNLTSQSIASRYPDGSTWQSLAAYLNYKYKPNRKFTIQSGLRYNHINIKADLTDNNVYYNFPFDNANLSTGAFSGSAGISWVVSDLILWKVNANTAFRAPNIDDVGKIFDSEPGSVVVPNSALKPEYAYGGEIGLTLNFNKNVILDLATYYTYLDNALVRRDFNLDGVTQIMYDGELSNVQAIQNASKAWIYGFEAGLKINFSEEVMLSSQFSIVGGTEEDTYGLEVPVRHVAPAFGNVHLNWMKNKLKLDAFVNFNGELSNNDLSPSVQDYLFALDVNGNPYSPSWYTLNLRSQYSFNDDFSLITSIENITNQLYRPYSSGISAPGTNLIVAIKYSM